MLSLLKNIKNKKLKWEDGREITLANINLQGAILEKADFSHANLLEANLQYTNLSEANLYTACLYRANLYEANLYKTNLSKADLKEADLRWANLWGTNLEEADLRGADLSYASIKNVHLAAAKLDGAKIMDNYTVKGDYGYIAIGPLGRRKDYTLFFNCNEGIYVKCGCFAGPIDLFQKKVKETHDNNNHASDYFDAIKYVKSIFKRR